MGYHESGGPKIDPEELKEMIIVAAVQQMSGLVSAVPQIIRMCPKKEWPTIEDRYDPRIALNVDDKSTIRLYLHCMNTILRIINEMGGAELVLDKFVNNIYKNKLGEKKPKPDEAV